MWEKIKSWLGFGNTNIEQIDTMKKFLVVGLEILAKNMPLQDTILDFKSWTFLLPRRKFHLKQQSLEIFLNLRLKGGRSYC